jgi:FkbH-like protein
VVPIEKSSSREGSEEMKSAASEVQNIDDLAALRSELADKTLTTAQIESAYRRITQCEQHADLKVAWLGNHTLDPMIRHSTVAAFRHGLTLANHAGAFNQHFQSVLDPGSDLHAHAPDAIVLSLSLRSIAPTLVSGGATLSSQQRQALAQQTLEQILQWVEAAKANTKAALLVCNFARPQHPGLGLADLCSADGDAGICSWLNENLSAAFRNDSRVHVLDSDHAIAVGGRAATWQPKMYHLAKMEWSGPGLVAVSGLVARALHALARPAKKCLVLDLDNTLWGGVVGEDGIDALHIAPGDPVGEAFLSFQRALIDISARGILLAIASKNNPEDAEEAFERIDMPLHLEHFATRRINWEHKHLNIQSMASELNIGLDSMVFVDDNPAECELVRQMLPEVEVIQLPRDPSEYAGLLLDCWHFDKLKLTDEDARKTEQYRENAARAQQRSAAPDLSAYLASLGTQIEIGSASAKQLPRLHQLFSKTNQFNLTTKRYDAAELEKFIASDDWLFEWVKVKDNFGDLGLVGLYLVKLGATEAEIDSLILSCRAMGRGIETTVCRRIMETVFDSGTPALLARYAPTQKNKPVRELYESQGFKILEHASDGGKLYRMTAVERRTPPDAEPQIAIKEES